MDFSFGYATAVFQNCTILVKKALPSQSNTITANGGKQYKLLQLFVFFERYYDYHKLPQHLHVATSYPPCLTQDEIFSYCVKVYIKRGVSICRLMA